MLKKGLIIVGIAVSILTNVILGGSLLINRIQRNAFNSANNQIANSIVASVAQKGEIKITVLDGNGGTKSMVLIPKGVQHGTPTTE